MKQKPDVSPDVLATKHFIGELDRLDKSLRKQFDGLYPVFREDPHDAQLDPEKLHCKVGSANVYSCRLNDAYRFIWTTEFPPASTLRLVGAHDATYRRAENMPPLQRGKIRPVEEMLRERGAGKARGSVTVSPGGCSAVSPTLAEQSPSDSDVYRFSHAEFQALLKGNIASWMLFLAAPHKDFVERTFNGPARVTGPSGSGKTALLLHRAVCEGKRGADAKVLVVCFNVSLAHVLSALLEAVS